MLTPESERLIVKSDENNGVTSVHIDPKLFSREALKEIAWNQVRTPDRNITIVSVQQYPVQKLTIDVIPSKDLKAIKKLPTCRRRKHIGIIVRAMRRADEVIIGTVLPEPKTNEDA